MARKPIRLPRRDGLVGEWLLDGNARDTAGTNNGTATNVTYAKTDRGYQAQCGVFNGTSSVVTMANNAPSENSPFTWGFWINYTQGATNGVVMGKIGNATFRGAVVLHDAWTQKLQLSIVNTSWTNAIDVRANSAYNDGKWHFVSFTYAGDKNGNNVGLFVDWQPAAKTVLTNNLTATISTTASFALGARSDSGNSLFLAGNLQGVKNFSRVLSDDEMMDWYLEGLRKLGKGSYAGLMDGLVGQLNSENGTELSDIVRGITATRTAWTAATDNLGFTKAITNPNYSYTSITYSNAYSFENSGAGWGLVSNPSGITATACNRTTTLREVFFYSRALSADEQTALSNLCKLDYILPIDGSKRIGMPENLKANCKLWYPGDVSGTTVFDASGNGTNGTTSGSPASQRNFGYKGWKCDATDDRITFNLSFAGDFTCAGFFNYPSFGADRQVFYLDNAANNRVMTCYTNSSGQIKAETYNGSTQNVTTTTLALATGRTYFIEVKRTWTSIKIYVDTVLWASGTAHSITYWGDTSYLLAGRGSIRFTPATVTNPSMFDKVLTQDESAQLRYSFFTP